MFFYIFYIIYNDIVYINNKEDVNMENDKNKIHNNFLYSLELDKMNMKLLNENFIYNIHLIFI